MLNSIMYPNTLCAVVLDGHLWFMNHVANAMMKMRLSDGVIIEWYQIEPYGLLEKTLFLDMVHYKDWLILIPDICGKHIVYFNLKTKEQGCILIPDNWFITKQAVWNDRMFLFSKVPTEQMQIAELDMERHDLQRKEEWEQVINDLVPDDIDRNHHIIDVAYGADKLWILIDDTKYLIEVDLWNQKGRIYTVGPGTYGRITYSPHGIYISDSKKCLLYRWDENSGIVETIDFGKCWESENPEDQYVYLHCHHNKICCVSRFSPWVDFYDTILKTKDILRVDTDKNEFPLSERAKYPFYQYRCVVDDEYLVILPNAGRDFFLMDYGSGETVEIRPMIPKSFYESAKREMNLSMLYERKLSLSRYMDYISRLGD